MYKIKLSQSNYTLSKPIRILTYWSPRNFENEEYDTHIIFGSDFYTSPDPQNK